ncbi:hypothetical protein ACLOJK_008592 [Asimina triloba]
MLQSQADSQPSILAPLEFIPGSCSKSSMALKSSPALDYWQNHGVKSDIFEVIEHAIPVANNPLYFVAGCDLRVVSDANSFFIETILKHHGVLEYFSVINSNPAFDDKNGKLRNLPYHDFNSSPHGCNLCSPNMCKGLIIERIHASVSAVKKKRFIYLGDGRGDFCLSTKLGEGEHVIRRKYFPLWELISHNPMLMKAKVHEWSNAKDVDRILIDLIKAMSDEDSCSHMLSVECKIETIPIPSHEAIPQVLSIRHWALLRSHYSEKWLDLSSLSWQMPFLL